MDECNFSDVSVLYVPIRDPYRRFVSGFVEFVSRAKRAGNDGRGDINLEANLYDLVSKIVHNRNLGIEVRLVEFLSLMKIEGFFDPHIFPQSYFVSRARRDKGFKVHLVDASNKDDMEFLVSRFGGEVKDATHSIYSIKSKSEFSFLQLFQSVLQRVAEGRFADTHLFSGKSGIYQEYGNIFSRKRSLGLFYSDVSRAVKSNGDVINLINELYAADFLLWKETKNSAQISFR